MLYRNNTNTTLYQGMETNNTPTPTPTATVPQNDTGETSSITTPNVLRCSIQGTHNRYQMKKVTRANELDKHKSRIATRTWDPSLYDIDTQLQLLEELGENISLEKRGETHLLMKKELETKLSGYRFQDQHKKRDGHNVTLEETIQKLLESKLLCYYCNRQCHVFYERVREMSQWSLDRIDNDLCHSVQNVVVACLQCNLHRKNTNSKKFKDTKSMSSVRLLESIPDPLHDTEISDPLSATAAPTTPTTRTQFISKKSLQKLTDQVVMNDRVIVSIQKELP
jgi:hypothetical protein